MVRQPGVTGADGTIVRINDRPAGIELTAAAVPHVDTVLTAEALAFVADLHRSLQRVAGGAAGAPGGAPGALRRRRAPRLPARDRVGPRGWRLARRPGAGRPPGSAGRDHRPGRPQDDDQRPQLAAPRSSWPTSRTPSPPPGRTSSTASSTCRDAVRRTISFRARGQARTASTSRSPPCSSGPAAGTCTRSTCWSTASPISASLFDFGLYFFHNAASSSLARGSGPYFYLPKLESHLEARLWNDVFVHAQERAGHPAGHDPGHGADRDDPRRVRDGGDPLRAARPRGRAQRRALGLHLQHDQEVPQRARLVLPDRAQVTMTVPFMRAYTELLVQDLPPARRPRHRRHGRVHPLAAATRRSTRRRSPEVREDKERESGGRLRRHLGGPSGPRPGGHRGLRRASWASVRTRRTGSATEVQVSAAELLDVRRPGRRRHRSRRADQRHRRAAVPRLLAAAATARRPINNLMEDAATAEISRSQIWQWRATRPTRRRQPMTAERYRPSATRSLPPSDHRSRTLPGPMPPPSSTTSSSPTTLRSS